MNEDPAKLHRALAVVLSLVAADYEQGRVPQPELLATAERLRADIALLPAQAREEVRDHLSFRPRISDADHNSRYRPHISGNVVSHIRGIAAG